MRTIIIGDIHGCNQAFTALLAKIQLGAEDRLVLLGDLFDRGPESWEVYQTVQRLVSEMGERFFLLRGNHEDYLLRPKLSLMERMVWERVGRGATVKSFKAHNAQMEDAKPWLAEHCQLFWRSDNLQCVHAGLMVAPIEVNDTNTLVHDHEVVLHNRYNGSLTVVGHIALGAPTYFMGDGQTTEELPYGAWRPLPKTGIICIDTGCGKGGKLTAMLIESNQYRLDCGE